MRAATGEAAALFGHDPATYRPHMLHGPDRTYVETNCYTDIIIELLHARGDEPLAAMGSIVRIDFEGDQWTFFKPRPEDLEALFGVDIHEMQPYRSIPGQLAELLALDRTMIVELDAFHLPDTAATSYRTEHVKTSVAVEAVDPAAERLRYYHNASLHELEGEDYREVFRLGREFSPDVLPPYAELVRFDAGPRLTGDELPARARGLTREHLARRPAGNPVERFGAQMTADLPGLLEGDAAMYHAYAFATTRMLGAASEIGAAHAEWLLGADGAAASAAFMRIVETTKALSFRLARRRPFDPAPFVDAMAEAWDEAVGALEAAA